MQFISNKGGDHSLTPDLHTGWRPNMTQHPFKQFPIYFTNPETDMLSKTLTSFGTNQPYRVVYMGPRFTSNLKAFKSYSMRQYEEENHQDQFDMYGEKFSKYEFKYLKQKQKVFPIRPLQYRLFTGMNPTLKKNDLQFDSNFQCGNLDLVILVNSFDYDLLMRVDSNTKGHTTWFYFKVKNFSPQQKVRFNLINFQKSGLLYNDGMKPYCFRSSKKVWEQTKVDLEYRNKRFRYCKDDDENGIVKRCLSFTYEFDKDDQYVYFAYCVPYSYSYLLHQVTKLQKENPHFVFLNQQHYSTGGLVIPILTITSSSTITQKKACLAIARLHPGETQGSWMMDGFLKFLCSQKAYYLRQKFIFKIIPMVNVDGVVLGNFRTSINGRDLNRFFHRPDNFQQVSLIRDLAQKMKPLLFLDFHGHSTKRNVFTYGPNYGVDHKYYLTARLLPKIISKLTNAFRYYSCLFKISDSKINASRAVMIRNFDVTYSFTIEASSHAYGPRMEEKLFNKDGYRDVGACIAESLIKFFIIIFKLPKRLENQKEKEEKEKGKEKEKEQRNEISSPSKKEKKKLEKDKIKQPVSNLFNLDKSILELFSQDKELLEELIADDKKLEEESKQQKKDDQPVSDSDFEEGCQYTDKQLKKMLKTQGSDDLQVKKKSISKKKKKKKTSKSKLQTVSPSPLPKEKSYTLPLKQKSHLSLQKRLLPVKPKVQRKLKVISVQEISSPQMSSIKSSILEPSASVFDDLEPSEESVANDSALNKVLYKNWKKFDNSSQMIPSLSFDKTKSVNHINLSYSQMESKEQNSEYQRLHEKAAIIQHMGKRSKKKMFLKDREWSRKRETEQDDEVMHIKESKLPILNKNSFNERKANLSYLQELLEYPNKVQNSYARKNLKIMYF